MDEKPLYPVLDPVRPAADMGFTAEQLAWLVDVATPRCCHTTGEHNLQHFVGQTFVCRDQLAEVTYRLREALGCPDQPDDRGWYRQRRADPSMAVSGAGCQRCAS